MDNFSTMLTQRVLAFTIISPTVVYFYSNTVPVYKFQNMYLHKYACTCTLYIHVYIWMLKVYLIMVCTMCHATFSISRWWKHTTYQHMVSYMLTRLHCSNNIYELTWLRYRTGWKCFKSNHFDKRKDISTLQEIQFIH